MFFRFGCFWIVSPPPPPPVTSQPHTPVTKRALRWAIQDHWPSGYYLLFQGGAYVVLRIPLILFIWYCWFLFVFGGFCFPLSTFSSFFFKLVSDKHCNALVVWCLNTLSIGCHGWDMWPLLVSVPEHFHIWAAAWQNQQNDMCAQHRLESLRCRHEETLSYPLSAQRRQIRLGGCPGWSESSLCAQVILLVLSCTSYCLNYQSSSWNKINSKTLCNKYFCQFLFLLQYIFYSIFSGQNNNRYNIYENYKKKIYNSKRHIYIMNIKFSKSDL